MNVEEFRKRWNKNRWFYVLENPTVEEWTFSYNNESTVLSLLRSVDYFIREVRKTNAEFDISDLFTLSSVQARKLIWSTAQKLMSRGKTNRISLQVKTFVSSLYNYAGEEEGKQIVWQRKHRISVVPTRDKQVPTHEEIYEMVDYATHTRDKAIILLSYHSGLKGTGIYNLNIEDLKPQLEKYKQDRKVPLLIRINARHYPKRFRGSNNVKWFPALIDRDCAEMLLKYYEMERKDANDTEPFFITRKGKRMGRQRISKQIRYLVDKIHRDKGTLGKNVYAMLLRDSFYNRLIKGNMKDIYREYLMMHSMGMRGYYFSWETDKEEIIKQYLKCGFNRESELNGMKRTVQEHEQKIQEQAEEIKRLRREKNEYSELVNILKEYDVRKLLKEARAIKTEKVKNS